MDFGTIFWPMFSALVAAFLVTQAFDFSVGYYFHKKQQKNRQEFEARVEKGEVSPAEMFAMSGGIVPGAQAMPGMPGAEGKKSENKPGNLTIGQYL